jgi:hypothetical protein
VHVQFIYVMNIGKRRERKNKYMQVYMSECVREC